jgi:hypothetical protein
MPTHLLDRIRSAYRLPLQNLRFLRRGWGGDCYSAETPNGEHYFLKFHDPSESVALAPSAQAFYLPLTYQLHHQNILPHIPHPIATIDGHLSLHLDPYTLVVTNFIEGDLVGFGPLQGEILAEVARLVGTLHRSLPELTFEQPFIEDFSLSFKPVLTRFLAGNLAPGDPAAPDLRSLNEALLPRRPEIQSALQTITRLQTYAQSSQPNMVICHTDIHGSNLIRGHDGHLYLLDWENAMIAPPEHDLIFFAGEKGFFDIFYPTYSRSFPAAQMDLRLLEFYFLRRALEDIADFILRIQSAAGTPARDREDVQECLDILDSLPGIQRTITLLANHHP